jgi:alpha-amylase/alpha-mannosidase (GH57 family)
MMSEQSAKLYLNLYWHMHQPDYRDTISNEFVLPWTYLHAIKDYTDMVYHVEQNPAARVTFNFVPVLLDQIEDYIHQFDEGEVRDPLLSLLARDNLDYLSKQERCLIVDSCFKSHHEKMLAPYAQYQRLHNIYNALKHEESTASNYLSGQYMADLLTWYHLAWMGESIKRHNLFVQGLMSKGEQFTHEERKHLFDLIGQILRELMGRYKQLLKQDRIEVSSTPHYHPILPLLLDFKSTRDAMPFAPLPLYKTYPHGEQRATAHIRSAQQSHLSRFGEKPMGMWPAEGAVSFDALSMLAREGVHWAATGQGVLANSLQKATHANIPEQAEYLYKPYRLEQDGHHIYCFFRDDHLSDKIGFEYAQLHASVAVADFVHELEEILQQRQGQTNPVVSVILDGENAWEYYPYNGFYFIKELYEALTTHPYIQMTTFSDILKLMEQKTLPEAEQLTEVAAGSWVYGSFSTWIGETDKNNAWDLLCEAKIAYDQVIQSNRLSDKEKLACERQLSICEGSDWFWWFGEYNDSVSVQSFDHLYRRNLINLYHLLKLDAPAHLSLAISRGSQDADNIGTMRRGQEVNV